jgi:hypothetical protein
MPQGMLFRAREIDHSALGCDLPGSSIQQSQMTVLLSLLGPSTPE